MSMRQVRIEKVVLSVGGKDAMLEKGVKLLKVLTGKTPKKVKSTKRIPSFGVRPGLEVGCLVTLRKKEADEMLKRLFASINNELREKQVSKDTVSFGIKEYIEIPGIEYQRDVGIMGFDVSISFSVPGKRVIRKKIKRGKFPEKQHVSPEEIIKFLTEKFGVNFK